MIQLTKVAKYYQEELHQKEALDWLQEQIDLEVLKVFAEKYRNKPPDKSTVCKEAIDLIKEFEGFSAQAYYCPAGVLTQGFGTTGSRVMPSRMITKAIAEKWLKEDVEKFAKGISTLVKVTLNKYQFGALVSFAYNVGLGAFKNSTLLKKLNVGDYDGAANEFKRWNKGGGKVLAGLVRRRHAEKDLFLK